MVNKKKLWRTNRDTSHLGVKDCRQSVRLCSRILHKHFRQWSRGTSLLLFFMLLSLSSLSNFQSLFSLVCLANLLFFLFVTRDPPLVFIVPSHPVNAIRASNHKPTKEQKKVKLLIWCQRRLEQKELRSSRKESEEGEKIKSELLVSQSWKKWQNSKEHVKICA